MKTWQRISKSIYLVIDPKMHQSSLLRKLEKALQGGVAILQIWNNWPPSFSQEDKINLIKAIEQISSAFAVPLLINEEWEMLRYTPISGVHFDKIPQNYKQIKSEIGRDIIAGITCSNDLAVISWAEENKLDYISFCSMFASVSVNNCEIVSPRIIRKARQLSQIPFFLSGGITIENIFTLQDMDFTGVALISGILYAEDPTEATLTYQRALHQLNL